MWEWLRRLVADNPQPAPSSELPKVQPHVKREFLDATDEVEMMGGNGAGIPVMTVPGESRPMDQQPIRFIRPGEGAQARFEFVVDPETHHAVRHAPPNAPGRITPNAEERAIFSDQFGRQARQMHQGPANTAPQSVPLTPEVIQANEQAMQQRQQDANEMLRRMMAQANQQPSAASR